MNKNIYKIDNSIERLEKNKSTLFLDQKEYRDIKGKLKNINYNIYLPYKDSEKLILYTKNIPKVSLFKIKSYNKLRHQDILGSLLGLNISSSYLGDIIVDNDNYYFYIISELDDYLINNLTYIGNNKIQIESISLNELENYERKYEELEFIVSSNRIDNILSKIINTNRDKIINKINNKEVIVNYNILMKHSYVLKEGDIFSIRRYGKYKYLGIINNTKKNKLVIKCLKYI
mgnify:CR=1 FL=1